MATTAPMFLELEQEEREKEIEQQILNTKDHDPEREINGKRILLAAEKGDIFLLVRLLYSNGTLINFADQDGYTPLHRACYGGHIDCVKYLCRHGANIEAETSDSWRPLHCAVRWNNVEAAQFLVDQGANINSKSTGDNTPLHIVASNGRYSLTCDIIQMLLFHPDCDYRAKNKSGDTAYDIAKRGGPLYRLWVGVMTLFPDDMDEEAQQD